MDEEDVKQEQKDEGAAAGSSNSLTVMENFVSSMVQALEKSQKQGNNKTYVPKVPKSYVLGQNFKSWLAQFNQYAKIACIPSTEIKDYLMTLLDQPAFRAVQLLRLPDDATFDVFTVRVIERFDSGKTVADYKLLLKNRKQNKGETFDNFADALLELTENAYPNASLEFRDELAKDKFTEGVFVAEEIREKLFLAQPSSLQEALRNLRSLESARTASHNIRKKMHCDVISTGNEKNSELKELKELVVSMKKKLECLEEQLEKQQKKSPNDVRCYSCQKMGHYASSCPEKRVPQGNDRRGLPRGKQTQ